jgi:hypothetical protein
MTDTGGPEVQEQTPAADRADGAVEPRRRRRTGLLLAALVLLVAGGYVWAATRPPSYVGKTEAAALVGDSCTDVLELYDARQAVPLHAVGGKAWLNRRADAPEKLLERASDLSTFSQTLTGRVHFTSAATATFTTDHGFVIGLEYRTRPTLAPGYHSCAIFGAN